MAAPRKYPNELRQRAIKLVVDAVAENEETVSGACGRIGPQLGINADTLRGWMKQVHIDQGERPGLTTSERQRLQTLEREVRELRRANAILKTASAFFAAELDRPQPH